MERTVTVSEIITELNCGRQGQMSQCRVVEKVRMGSQRIDELDVETDSPLVAKVYLRDWMESAR